MRKQRGFSLIELLVVVAIILVSAAVAIPNLLRTKIAANESSAVASLRTIATAAEATYASNWGTGYARTLNNLGGPAPCTVATGTNACLIDPLLSTGPNVKSGYSFAAIGNSPASGVNTGFEANATPTAVDISGKRAFCLDQTGVLRANITGVAIGTAPGICATTGALIIGN
jgi:prepilin-type N-terminal cleavage/methylation domain-containing protein